MILPPSFAVVRIQASAVNVSGPGIIDWVTPKPFPEPLKREAVESAIAPDTPRLTPELSCRSVKPTWSNPTAPELSSRGQKASGSSAFTASEYGPELFSAETVTGEPSRLISFPCGSETYTRYCTTSPGVSPVSMNPIAGLVQKLESWVVSYTVPPPPTRTTR